MLIKAYELVRSSEVFFDRASLEWASQFYSMYKRGWLYGATQGEELLAVAGAFRIPEWDEKYRHEIPEKESGNLLYVSFFCSQSSDNTVALKLLKCFLRENPEIEEIIYFKKDWDAGRKRFKLIKPKDACWENALHEISDSYPTKRKRIVIEPPEFASAFALQN